MKKIFLIAVISIISVHSLPAQSWDEWFRQKKTQLKYLTEQIAAFRVYAGYLEKGYHIASQGLTTISAFKKGEFSLHHNFFASLASVNPTIRHNARVAEIIAMQLSIVQKYKQCYKQVRQSDKFHLTEVNYIEKVFTGLLTDCVSNIAELITLITDGQLQLTDDERLRRIDAIHADMKDKYSFSQSFSNGASVLAAARQKELNETKALQNLYNLK